MYVTRLRPTANQGRQDRTATDRITAHRSPHRPPTGACDETGELPHRAALDTAINAQTYGRCAALSIMRAASCRSASSFATAVLDTGAADSGGCNPAPIALAAGAAVGSSAAWLVHGLGGTAGGTASEPGGATTHELGKEAALDRVARDGMVLGRCRARHGIRIRRRLRRVQQRVLRRQRRRMSNRHLHGWLHGWLHGRRPSRHAEARIWPERSAGTEHLGNLLVIWRLVIWRLIIWRRVIRRLVWLVVWRLEAWLLL